MKINLLLMIASLGFSTTIKAQDCVDCTPEQRPFVKIEKSLEALQVATSVNCTDHLKNEANSEYLENFSKLPNKSEIVKGIKLSGSAEEIKFIKKMLGSKPTDAWEKAKGCNTVLCALTKVYDSEEAAQRSLNIAKRAGYIVSLQKDFNFEKKDVGELFSAEELQIIDLAYKKLPTGYKKLRSLDVIKRLPHGLRSNRSPNAAAYASPGFHSSYYEKDGEITFVDSAFLTDKTWAPLVAVHELSHHVDFSKSDKNSFGHSESPAYLKLSGWKKKEVYEVDKDSGKKVLVVSWEHAKNKKFVTSYAKTSPAEDLGDTAAFYVFEPNKLKALDPDKYDYMKKNIFGGKEYIQGPDFQIADEEIFKRCMKDTREITLWGKEMFNSSISEDCLDKFIKEYKISDPKFCEYSKDQLKQSLFDKINPSIEAANLSIKKCDESLNANKSTCIEENNFQKSCSIDKCQLDETLKPKVREIGNYVDVEKLAYQAVIKKLGPTEFVTMTLINGLSGKNKISTRYPLETQQDFLENAGLGLAQYVEKENFKFDSKKDPKSRFQTSMMLDKSMSENLAAFQAKVLKSATKSKEKNLELIKAWAASQSLEDSPQFNELAEAIIKYR